jgi:DNA gyrase subunit A
VRRRTEFELRKAEARAHILEGLKVALDHLDAVIRLIRAAPNPAAARENLIGQFELSLTQAQAILDMQLQRLTGLERQKVIDELAELVILIDRLRGILGSETQLMGIVVDELRAVQGKYGDDRRTEVVDDPGELRIEDLIAEEDMAITVSNTGYVKRTAITEYRSQRRGGKGRIGMRTRDADFLTHLFVASTHAYILILSDRGRLYWLKVHTIPDVGPSGKGKAIANLVSMQSNEKISALLAVREWPAENGQKFIVTATKMGTIKKTDLRAFRNPRQGGIIAVGVADNDAVITAEITDGQGQVLLATRLGKAIRFAAKDARPMGRSARGVRGIRLRDDDEVVAMAIVRPTGTLLTVTENGYGKRTDLGEYRSQSRGGVGIISIQTTTRNGRVAGIVYVEDEDELMLITQQGKVLRMETRYIRSIGRSTQGVRLIEIEDEDLVVSLARLSEVSGDPETSEPQFVEEIVNDKTTG